MYFQFGMVFHTQIEACDGLYAFLHLVGNQYKIHQILSFAHSKYKNHAERQNAIK